MSQSRMSFYSIDSLSERYGLEEECCDIGNDEWIIGMSKSTSRKQKDGNEGGQTSFGIL